MTNLDLNELRATYDHPADRSVIELIERVVLAEYQVSRVREIAKADLRCPCCSGYEEILRTLDGEQDD